MSASDHLPPTAPFFMHVNVTNNDGTLDLGCEGLTGYTDLASAIEATTEDIEENGGEAFIYECRPVRKIARGKVRVTVLGAKR